MVSIYDRNKSQTHWRDILWNIYFCRRGVKMIEAYLTWMIEKEKVLSQVDYLSKTQRRIKLSGKSPEYRWYSFATIKNSRTNVSYRSCPFWDDRKCSRRTNTSSDIYDRRTPTVFGFELAAKVTIKTKKTK